MKTFYCFICLALITLVGCQTTSNNVSVVAGAGSYTSVAINGREMVAGVPPMGYRPMPGGPVGMPYPQAQRHHPQSLRGGYTPQGQGGGRVATCNNCGARPATPACFKGACLVGKRKKSSSSSSSQRVVKRRVERKEASSLSEMGVVEHRKSVDVCGRCGAQPPTPNCSTGTCAVEK